MLKVRRDQKPGDYSDPGWYKAPPGTVASEWKGSAPHAPQPPQKLTSKSSAALNPAPGKTMEVQVRKPKGGHGGH
jgi:manganese oxidase